MEEEFLNKLSTHQALIQRICLLYRDTPEDREDLRQEIVYQLWKAYPKFRGEAKFSTWLYRIGLNTALAAFRERGFGRTVASDQLDRIALPDTAGSSERSAALWRAIKQLDESDRAIVALHLEGLRYAEIATVIGISENYVGVKLTRIKAKLKQQLNS